MPVWGGRTRWIDRGGWTEIRPYATVQTARDPIAAGRVDRLLQRFIKSIDGTTDETFWLAGTILAVRTLALS